MKKKKEIVPLWEIDPNQFYFLPRSFLPVKIVCTDTAGWQRGLVRLELQEGRCPRFAYAETVDTKHRHMLSITRDDDQFYFYDYQGPSLLRIDSVDVNRFKSIYLSELEKAEADVNWYTQKIETLATVAKHMSWKPRV